MFDVQLTLFMAAATDRPPVRREGLAGQAEIRDQDSNIMYNFSGRHIVLTDSCQV